MMADVIPFGFLMVVRRWCRQTVSGWCSCGGGVSINGSGGGPFCSAAIIPVMICQVFARNEEMANRFVELSSRVHLLIILARRNESAPHPSQPIPLPLPLPMLYHHHLHRLASRRLSLAGKSKFVCVYIYMYKCSYIYNYIYQSRAPTRYLSLSWFLGLPPSPPLRCRYCLSLI